MPSLKYLKNHDYIITICTFLLSFLSLVLIYSTTYNSQTLEAGAGTFRKQILFFILGFSIYFALSIFDITWLQNRKILVFLFSLTIGLLIYVKFFTTEIASTNRWITIFGFNLQPAEYAKITLTIITAAIFSSEGKEFSDWIHLGGKKRKSKKRKFQVPNVIMKFIEKTPRLHLYLLSTLITLTIIVLVFIQPALGNSVIILTLWVAVIFVTLANQLAFLNFFFPIFFIPLVDWNVIKMEKLLEDLQINFFAFGEINISVLLITLCISILFSLKSKLKWYAVIIAILLALSIKPAVTTIWDSSLLTPYQKERVETFFNDPEEDPLDAGFQVRQSKIAIGAGRLFGRGYLKGTQSTLKILPFAHTDFIFASLAEQFGLVGSCLLMLIYIVLLARILISSTHMSDEFSSLITVGFAVMILLNIFINIGMNLGVLPVTGVPLPLVSYGGSSVLVNLIGLGLVQAARKRISIKDVSEKIAFDPAPWK